MNMKNRMLALGLSAMMALSPMAAMAENTTGYAAGELTRTVISDSYSGGNQINLSATFSLEQDETMNSARTRALVSLLEKSEISMSFYDDFGTMRVNGELTMDGLTIISGSALIYEDGSAQVMTNLTGKNVLALPAGTLTQRNVDLMGMLYGESSASEDADLSEMSATDRLRQTASDVSVTIFSHLLGWVSFTQMETGELYVFDDTYLEETPTRDAVAQRMIGTIQAHEFTTLVYNIIATICDEKGDFQQALADVLAENGVTRYQARQVIDSWLTEETIVPDKDFVQPSHAIADDGALCTYDDVSYFFKKLFKAADKAWQESLDSTLSMTVSYDDYGNTVGFDAELPKFTENLPYEGAFTYSLKTDEHWQTSKSAHGELELLEGNRIVGDLSWQMGQDVDGLNASGVTGYLDLLNHNDNTSVGMGVEGSLIFEKGSSENGNEQESIAASAALRVRESGEEASMFSMLGTGTTTTDGSGFVTEALISMNMLDAVKLQANVTIEQGEYEEISFAGGQAIDVTDMTDEQMEQIKNEVIAQGTKLSLSMVLHPGVLSDILTLISQ